MTTEREQVRPLSWGVEIDVVGVVSQDTFSQLSKPVRRALGGLSYEEHVHHVESHVARSGWLVYLSGADLLAQREQQDLKYVRLASVSNLIMARVRSGYVVFWDSSAEDFLKEYGEVGDAQMVENLRELIDDISGNWGDHVVLEEECRNLVSVIVEKSLTETTDCVSLTVSTGPQASLLERTWETSVAEVESLPEMFITLMALSVCVEGTLKLRSTFKTQHALLGTPLQTVAAWSVNDGQFVPLKANEVFARENTDRTTGELLGPEGGLDYLEAFDLTS